MSAQVAAFVPYRKTSAGWEFYMQRRDANAPTNANMLSLFGGHLEDGEDSIGGVLREIREELEYTPAALNFFGADTFIGKELDIYVEEVGNDFESRVVVHEGEYGAFFSAEEVAGRPDVSEHGKRIVQKIHAELAD